MSGSSLPQCLTKNSVIKSEDGFYISLYSDELTKECVVKGGIIIKASFPNLSNEFISILSDRFMDKGFTDNRLNDCIKHVIDTCQYPTPTMAQFLSFDKRKKLYTYNDICLLVDKGDNFKYYEIKEIDGVKWWVKKEE